jgi:hypothetical protein
VLSEDYLTRKIKREEKHMYNTPIEIKEVTKNLLTKYYGKVDHEILKIALHQLNTIVPYKMSAHELLLILKRLIDCSTNMETKKLYADCYVYVEYISGISIERVIKPVNPIMLCNERNLDRCSMYCDGYDTSCECYSSDAIEVISFEEGDPQ